MRPTESRHSPPRLRLRQRRRPKPARQMPSRQIGGRHIEIARTRIEMARGAEHHHREHGGGAQLWFRAKLTEWLFHFVRPQMRYYRIGAWKRAFQYLTERLHPAH